MTISKHPNPDHSALAKMLMNLFNKWKVSTDNQFDLLGLSRNNRSVLTRYHLTQSIGSVRDTIDRAGHLLAIHKSLRMLFPHDRYLAYQWVSTRNKAFDQHSPVETIRDMGFSGLLMVRSYLDRMLGQ